MRIIVCDDNEDNARTLGFLMGSVGHETRVCFDGQSCLETAARWQPHVALLDIGLPDINGYLVASELRRLPFGTDVLILAVTGYAAPSDVARALASGFDKHFAKPPDLPELFKAIEEHGHDTARP